MIAMTDRCYWGRLCSALESIGPVGTQAAAEIRADMHCGDEKRMMEVRVYCRDITSAIGASIDDSVEQLTAKLKLWAMDA